MRNIEKILLKGSPKQRMSLICEYRAAHSYWKPLPFTDEEYKKLDETFKTSYEIKVFNKMSLQERNIRHYLPNMQTMRLLYMNQIEKMRGLCLCENVFNKILSCVKCEDTKNKIKQIIKESLIGKKDLEKDVSCTNFQADINACIKESKEYLIQTKTMIEVVRAFMKNSRNEIKVYKQILKGTEALIDASLNNKYNLLKGIFPNHEAIEIDEGVFKEQYDNSFKGDE